MKSNLKIAFLGTPEFAVPILTKLVQDEFRPAIAVCAPDKPAGRTQSITPPPVKISAQKFGLEIFQTEKTEELEKLVLEQKPDLIVCAAFSLILTKKVLETPRFGCLNIHPSLLPRWRGASPIQAAILAGDKISGVTIILMDEKIDHGPIVAKKELEIDEKKFSAPELSLSLAKEGADLLLETLPPYLEGKIKPETQNEAQATFSKIIKKEDGKIDWQKPAEILERQIRAFHPWPGCLGEIGGRKIKIIRADFSPENFPQRKIGEIFLDENENLAVQTGQGCLILKILQPEGKKPLAAEDFLRGRKDLIGQIFS